MLFLGMLIGIYMGAAIMCILFASKRADLKIEQMEEEKCLHCGKNIASYCESCYQELIGINAKLQYENTELKGNNDNHIPFMD